ncbi:MAG: Trk family potassium uptake protein [Lachnospiraceae bacterium]|nr:Trk family potassium uptake protein [Lachnospiraceae bacterium]
MLPVSSKERVWTSFIDALFTATSAGCVTGLIVHDTATYWSVFGKIVLFLLIQAGGLGIITMTIIFFRLAGKKIGLVYRSTMQEAVSAPSIGGIIQMTGRIVRMTVLIELLGALCLSPVFIRDFGIRRGITYSLFHSVSAFCNAGFDLMGHVEQYSSFTFYANEPVTNVVLMALILIGGMGFLTWDDVRNHGYHLKRYSTQSKLILVTALILIFVPAIYFFFADYREMPFRERLLRSLFQSVTTRTAGFNTSDQAALSGPGYLLTVILMLIGGAPGSTAGGMKMTTAALMVISMVSVFGRKRETALFRRRVSQETIRTAGAIFMMYLFLFLLGGILLSVMEGLPLRATLFESASAVGTVGLTTGITPELGTFSKIILAFLMFTGRVGGLTMIFAAVSTKDTGNMKYPEDRITVG